MPKIDAILFEIWNNTILLDKFQYFVYTVIINKSIISLCGGARIFFNITPPLMDKSVCDSRRFCLFRV